MSAEGIQSVLLFTFYSPRQSKSPSFHPKTDTSVRETSSDSADAATEERSTPGTETEAVKGPKAVKESFYSP